MEFNFFIAMKAKILIILFSFLFISCIERNGYYSYEEESVISLICDITWSTSTYKTENDEIGQTTYNFNRNGIYKRTDIVTNQNGEEKNLNIMEDGLLETLVSVLYISEVIIIGI